MAVSYIEIVLGVILGIILSGMFPNLPKWFMQLGNNIRDYTNNQKNQEEKKDVSGKSSAE